MNENRTKWQSHEKTIKYLKQEQLTLSRGRNVKAEWATFPKSKFSRLGSLSVLNKLVFGTDRANKSFKQKNHKTNSQTSEASNRSSTSMIYDRPGTQSAQTFQINYPWIDKHAYAECTVFCVFRILKKTLTISVKRCVCKCETNTDFL